MAIFTKRVNATNGDAVEKSDGTGFTTNPTSGLGAGITAGRSGGAGNPYWYSGFHFTSVTIPKNASIIAAKLTFTDQGNNTVNAMTVPIYCEATDNADNFAITTSVTGRTTTTATASWSVPTTQTTDTTHDTVDFKSVIQEVVDRAGWASGNALCVLLRTSSATAGETWASPFYEDSTTKCALLTIDYSLVSESDTSVATDSISMALGASISETSTVTDTVNLKVGFSNPTKSSTSWSNTPKT